MSIKTPSMEEKNTMKISVVIPVYGCREALPELHRRLTESVGSITDDYEIILVNDNCPQNSWEVIEQICREDKHVVGLEMSRNFGQLKATLAGLDYSSGDWVVVMDCDLQDRPEEIVNLYHKAMEGYDFVVARRAHRQDSGLKVFVSDCFYSVYSFATDVKYDPTLCNFSICSRKVINHYCQMRELHRAYTMYLLWMGFKWTALDVDHNERYAGKSGYNFKKRMRMAFELLTSQSDKLLRMMALLGMIISLISIVFVVITIIRHFTMNIAVGYSSHIAMTSLMGGMTIMSVGIVGIYVGNIFMEVKHRPLYIVRTVLNGKEGVKHE